MHRNACVPHFPIAKHWTVTLFEATFVSGTLSEYFHSLICYRAEALFASAGYFFQLHFQPSSLTLFDSFTHSLTYVFVHSLYSSFLHFLRLFILRIFARIILRMKPNGDNSHNCSMPLLSFTPSSNIYLSIILLAKWGKSQYCVNLFVKM